MTVDRDGTFWRISAIARNAFREAVRDRVLYNLVLFVLLLTAAACYLRIRRQMRRMTRRRGLAEVDRSSDIAAL